MNNTIPVTFPDYLNIQLYSKVPKFYPDLKTKYQDRRNNLLIRRLEGSLCFLDKIVEELRPLLANESLVEISRDNEAIHFCAENNLIKYLGIAENITRKHFPTAHKIHISHEHDPETIESWVTLEVQISGDIDEVIEWEDNFVREWVSNVPFPESSRIRLSCDII